MSCHSFHEHCVSRRRDLDSMSPQVLLNLAAAPGSCQAVRDAGIAMVLQSLIHSVAAALSSRSGRRSPRSQREVCFVPWPAPLAVTLHLAEGWMRQQHATSPHHEGAWDNHASEEHAMQLQWLCIGLPSLVEQP